MAIDDRRFRNLTERARILSDIRAFFVADGFLEVETPYRIPANAPEAYIDAVESEGWFLQTSPELAMKRLLARGYPSIFQLCRCWRSGERGRRHLGEFTMLEWYRLAADYRYLMHDCEGLLRAVAPVSNLVWGGMSVDLNAPWEYLSVDEAFRRYSGRGVAEAIADDRFEEILDAAVEPNLGREVPTFLYDYPASMAALARKSSANPEVAERFELYVAGLELANGFSELTDATEQRMRFEEEEGERRRAGKKPYPVAEPFLQELSRIPAAAGIALGIDRLIMLLTGSEIIDDVVAFTPEEL